MSETIVRLEDLEDAVPKFRLAADDINIVNSTVKGALQGLGSVVRSDRGDYTSTVYEELIIELADALDRAIRDYDEAINAPVGEAGGGILQPLPDEDEADGDDSHTKWPDGKPPKDKDKGKDKDDEGEDSDQSSSGETFPPSSSSSSEDDEDEDSHPGQGQGQGNQGQQGGQGQGQGQSGSGNTGQGQSGSQSGNQGGEGQGGAAGGVVGAVMGALGLGKKKKEEEEEEEAEEQEEYVSAVNAPVKQELDDKTALLAQTETRVTELEAERADKAELLGRLQAAAAASGETDSQLEERIEQLKKELTEIDTELYYGNEDIPKLRQEIEVLQKRLDTFHFGPDADWEAIRSYEGGETSIWIREATRNEDNSVNCVNYVVNRMPIPPELPFNAHLWDEQVMKYGPKYGITMGEVPMEGSVIVMEREHSYANDIYGHVMYVEKVDENGVVWVTDNNYMDKPVRLDDLTSETSGPYIHYLYFPWQTKV